MTAPALPQLTADAAEQLGRAGAAIADKRIPDLRQPDITVRRLGRKKASDVRDEAFRAEDRAEGIAPGSLGDAWTDHPDQVELIKREAAARQVSPAHLTNSIPDAFADLAKLVSYRKQSVTLDQGASSRCVWFGGEQMIYSGPVMQKEQVIVEAVQRVTGQSAPDMEGYRWLGYFWLQDHDEWPGREPTYFGTSERAWGRFVVAAGLATEYLWFNSLVAVARALAQGWILGFGRDHFEGMDTPDKNGFIWPTGRWRGGHFTVLDGVNIIQRKVREHNSWGDEWGTIKSNPGSSWMSFSTLDWLFGQGAAAIGFKELRFAA